MSSWNHKIYWLSNGRLSFINDVTFIALLCHQYSDTRIWSMVKAYINDTSNNSCCCGAIEKKKDSLKSNSMKREWVQWNWFFLFLQDFIAHTLSRFAFSSNKALFLRFVCRCTILNHSKRFVIIILNEMPYSCAWILISFFRLSVDAIFAVDCQEIP